MRRELIATIALVLLAAPVAAQALNPWIEQGGGVYHATTGRMGSALISDGPAFNGTGILGGDACAYSKLQPEFDRGRVRLQARLDDGTRLMVDLNRFSAWPDGASIALDEKMDGRHAWGAPAFPELDAEAAVHGLATLQVNDLFYDDPMQGIGQYNYSAEMVLTQAGYREDGAVRGDADYQVGDDADTRDGDVEMYLRLRSRGDTGAPTALTVTEPPQDGLVPARLVYNPEYVERIAFANLRYGGMATLDIDIQTEAAPGLNELNFRVRAPNGRIVYNDTIAPSVLASGSTSTTFPLDLFGDYVVEVSGQVALLQYELTMTQEPVRPMDLWFQWEEVAYGVPALDAYADCLDGLGSEDNIRTTAVGRPEPPQLRKPWVIVGIVGGVVIGLTAIALVGTAVANATHRSAYRK